MKIILSTLLLLTIAASTASAKEPTHLTYEEFIKQVEAGKIKTVTLGESSSIQGTWMEEASVVEFNCSATGTASDPLLLALLKEHDVKVSISKVDESDYSPKGVSY